MDQNPSSGGPPPGWVPPPDATRPQPSPWTAPQPGSWPGASGPWGQPHGTWGPPPGPAYPAPNGKRFGWGAVIAGFLVGGISAVVGGFFLLILIGLALGDDLEDPASSATHAYVRTEAQAPEVGDCLVPGPQTADVTGPDDVVDCDDSHGSEVAAVLDVPGAKVRPSSDDLDAFGEDACYLAFEEYVGSTWDDSALDYVVVTPDADAWQRGDRSVWCLVDTTGGYGEDGTVRGSHR